jgi:hypothetical protein
MKNEKPGGMKKIIYFLLVLFCIPFQILAISGDGSYTTPYSGALTTNMNWSGTVYVNGDVTVDGYTLTISPGAIIVFLTPGSDIIITGTGVLTADGTNSSMIRFTADSDNSGTFGGTGETWGHISFQDMTSGFTTPSVINYCIIEFGYKDSSPWGFESSGGGIQTAYTYLTISNSIIRNNYAGWGGGIYVNANTSPSISNCEVSNNTAGTTGGGISIYQYSAAVVTNSVIVKNTCNGGGGGGGVFVGNYPDNVRFYNCVVASNLSTTNPGNNIRIWKSAISTGPRFYNIIVWGSDNSINFLEVGPEATDFNYCAIQGYTTGYTNCFNLSATNNDPVGPNFYNVTTGSEDYRINYISPCRDAGTSSGAPATDYLGKSRIGNYDIGAYEVQYSWWTGATNDLWTTATNWVASVDPSTGSGDVIIPTGLSNYPTGSTSQNFTIGSGKTMILGPGAKATFGTLTNSGTLKLESDASNISSLIVTTFSGTAIIQLYLSGGGTEENSDFKWHYISTPVSSLPVSTFAPGSTLNVAQFVESRPVLALMQGWVAYDGYVYSTGLFTGPTFSTLTPGKGYNFFDNTDNIFTFSGSLNTTDAAMSLGYGGTPSMHGFNLLGNPFSSGLDWDDIVNGTYYTYPANTSKGLYFTRDNVQCTYIGGVGNPGDVTGIIPPMQGFFTKTYSTGNTITLPAASRTQTGIHARYKGSTIIPLIRLKITEYTKSDETVVRFDQLAKSYLDNDFDALKMFVSATTTSIYSSLSGTNYAINGQPFPETFIEIPIVINLTTDSIRTISAFQLQGLDNYDVTLKDNSTGFTANLKTTPVVTFSSPKGTIADRFMLKISAISTGNEDPLVSNNTFNIYPANDFINIQTISDTWNGMHGSVKVLDLTGKTISDLMVAEFSKNSLIQVEAPMAKGMYVVEIRSGALRYVGKMVVR